MVISLKDRTASAGVERLVDFRGTPDAKGLVARSPIEPPPFECACYYAPFQKYDLQKAGPDRWPEGANRMQALRITDFRGLTNGGLFVVFKLLGGGYLAVLPISGPRSVAWLNSEQDRLMLNIGTLGTEPIQDRLPLCAWARAEDPFRAAKAAWEGALGEGLVGQSARMRHEKHYPEIFRYLGWCSWEEFHAQIDETVLCGAVRTIEKSPAPVRYVLVDDGHLDHEKRRLKSFDPDPSKFPRGWENLMRLKSEKVRWIGVWLNFNGYWEGVSMQNHLGALNRYLAPVPSGALQPREDFLSSAAFYDAMIVAARRHGFDFVKVDNQAKNLKLNTGTANAAESAANNAQALEQACARHMDGLINCMAHGPECIFNTRLSVVSRCSEDYKLGDLQRARRHLHNSYANLLWMGWTMWGDHDMFHSNDPVSGQMMAISKALSGGPVYLSDNPAGFALDHIAPLCFDDGLLLRPLAPAAPLPDSIFLDPFADGKPYRAIAPLPNGAAVVVAYNLTEPAIPVSGGVGPDDYAHAGCLMLPEPKTWAAPSEGLLAYDWRARQAARLEGEHRFTLTDFSDTLVLLCPIRNGWAVVGRPDKYLSPAAVEVIDCAPSELIVRMKESGPLTVWSERGKLSADAHADQSAGSGLWTFKLPAGQRDVLVRINRGG